MKIARGMLRPGSSVSSPSEAAPSKPPKDRKPNTEATAIVDSEIPLAGEKTLSVKPWSLGAEPPITLAKMTTISTRISVTEMPSRLSSVRVATRMSPNAKIAMNTIATSARISQSTLPAPMPSRNVCPNSPTSAADAIVNSV